MARTSKRLSAVDVKAKTKPGRYADGDGLYLNIAAGQSKSWVFLWMKDGKRREMGLGSYPTVTLGTARQRVEECRRQVSEGLDPIAERKKAAPVTFGDAADKFLASMSSSFRNAKHRDQWKMTLGDAYCAALRKRPISAIDTEDVLKVLAPVWQTKAETASRIRGRIERVLDFAAVKGWRAGENPARWRGHLKNALPARQKLARGHHAAMPYAEVPAFIARLQGAEAMAARGLEFLILNAARSGEVMGAKWPEIDLDAAVWTVPAERMKAGKEHRVPLTPRSAEILKALKEARVSDYVFPGEKKDAPLSTMAFPMLMRRMKVDQYTAHGFRSAFRDWAGDETSFPRELAEAALAHRVGDETERAYRRSDALARRRKLMVAWSDYCFGSKKPLRLVAG
ncbi:phage integrase central domain-containing protein [Mesorhizobium sp. BE184]|uniref:tyrosine-type recombinase/integrase n=1 Tax=Mesorhizobium sp. BE184 TaxID=2817714 RepID=UPI00286C40BE|nr:integrase arm-type DNA-binding domain-containing protein [Mesorhizobium sp. BE184]